MITQRLGAEEGDTPVEQQPAAMQDFDPTYDRCGRQCDETAPTLRAKAALGGQLSAPPLRRRLRTVPNTAGYAFCGLEASARMALRTESGRTEAARLSIGGEADRAERAITRLDPAQSNAATGRGADSRAKPCS